MSRRLKPRHALVTTGAGLRSGRPRARRGSWRDTVRSERAMNRERDHFGRASWPSAIRLAISATLLLIAGCEGWWLEAGAQEQVNARSEGGELECLSYCSPTRPGTALMEVKVRLAESPLSEPDLRARASRQGLEVTVYADGFAEKRYATLDTLAPKARFRAPLDERAPRAAARPVTKLPGLEKLVVSQVASRLERPARNLRLEAPPGGPEWLVVRLEGLNPGMNYTYRASGGRPTVACEAVVCPVDEVRPPAKRSPAPR